MELAEITSLVPINAIQAFSQAKITPARTIDLITTGEIIYEFWKANDDTKGNSWGRTTKRDIALITVSRDKQRFKVSFYSKSDGTQVIQDLEISKLREAVNELKAAGFN